MSRSHCLGRVGFVLLIALAVLGSGAGCAKLPTPNAQHLVTPLPQAQIHAAPSGLVWHVASDLGRREAQCGVLADSTESRVISWCENAVNWRDLGQDMAAPKYEVTNAVDPNMFEKFAQKPGKGYALTTLWVDDLGDDRSRLRIRRVFVGAESFPGMGHSRGRFEQRFQKRVARGIESERPRWEEQRAVMESAASVADLPSGEAPAEADPEISEKPPPGAPAEADPAAGDESSPDRGVGGDDHGA